MAYASGEKRNGAPSLGGPGPPSTNGANIGASGPSPPSQPRKSSGSRPVLSARPTTASNAGPTVSGPLVASMLGGTYPYHNRTASPAPQRNVSSPQHASSQRSTSASLQRTSSSRQRSSHGQIPGKPFFAAYGLQYSSNGRNGSGMGSATSRTTGTMSPYRSRPSSSTGPPSTGGAAAVAAVGGRPSTSQTTQRAAGENWFGNTKLSVTLPNEAARVVQELGQLLSVFAPPAPSAGPSGPKAPGSFRASKYVGGSSSGAGSGITAAAVAAAAGGGAHKEAWGSVGAGGSGDVMLSANGSSALMRPTSAASSTGSASKPIMAPFMGDGRHVHAQGANLSLMRLQQQQPQSQPPAVYSGVSCATGMLVAAPGVGSQSVAPYTQQTQQQQPSYGAGGLAQVQGVSHLHSAFLTYQTQVGSGCSPSHPPPRLNLAMIGGGSGGVAMTSSLPEPGGGSASQGTSPTSSPHGVPSLLHYQQPLQYSQTYPHGPSGSAPPRPWEGPSSGLASGPVPAMVGQPQSHGYMAGQNAMYSAAAPAAAQMAPPQSNSGGGGGGNAAGLYHYLPFVDGQAGSGSASAATGAAASASASPGYTTVSLTPGAAHPAATFGQSSGFHASPAASMGHPHAAATPPSLITSAAAAVALGTHPALQPLPVPSAMGPVPLAPPSSLAPASHSAPLHFAIPTSAGAPGAATGVLYNPAGKGLRDSLLANTTYGNSSSGNVSSPSTSSSASQVQPAPCAGVPGISGFPGSSAFAAFVTSTAASSPPPPPPLSSFRSSSLANAPHPMGLPPPSPLKVVPPAGNAPGSGRGAFIRSSSSRSSNGSGSGCDNGPYYNGTLLPTVQDVEREDPVAGSGDDTADARQPTPQTPMQPIYGSGSEDGGGISAAPAAAAASPGYGGTNASGSSVGGSSGGAHVTWAANVTHGSGPGTPTKMYNTSYSDLAARRFSASQMGVFESASTSPFARGPEGYSRGLVEHGTLTCVRPSTVPSNFAADSQPDLSTYGDLPGSGEQGSGGSEVQASGGGSASVSVSLASPLGTPTWTPSGTGLVTGTSLAAAAAAASAHQPWRRSTDNAEQAAAAAAATSGGSGAALQQQQQQQTSSAATAQEQQQQLQQRADANGAYSVASAYATAREDGVWGRSRDPTPTRPPYGQSTVTASPTPAQQQQPYPQQQQCALRQSQQQQQLEFLRQSAGDAAGESAASAAAASASAAASATTLSHGYSSASTSLAAPAAMGIGTSATASSTMPSAFASALAMRQVDASAAAASAGAGGGMNGTSRYTSSSINTSGATAATTTYSVPATISSSSAATSSASAAAAASSTSAGVPAPNDQLRPRSSVPQQSPRYSPWADVGATRVQSTTAPAPSTPCQNPTAAAACSSAHTTTSSSATATATGTTTTTTATATTSASTPSPTAAVAANPAPAASSSPAASSAAGSAVSSGSNSSGTASSSAGYGSGSASATAAAAPGPSLCSSAATAAAVAAAGSQHQSAMRRSGSIVTRSNPVAILGSELDPTFGNLLPGYSVGKVIGEGGFCQVRLAVHHLSQRKVAVKVIDRAKLSDPNEAKRMQREIRVMKHLSHQCVIKLFEVVESPRHLFLVMEHAPAGSLLDYVRARKRLPEADACVFFQQIVSSLEYCHSREVVHRDIKLENILLDVDQRMKLIDFGLSAFFVPGKRLRVHCGSPSYAAPEIVARKAYEGPPVDVWSLGVVLFAMVAGYLPFHASGGNKQELCNKIIAGQYTAPDWLSSSMKDLLSRMLTTDPEKRITFSQVWQHNWVRNGPQWRDRGINCYEVLPDPSAPGGLRCDEQVVAELEAAGFSRASLVQHLATGDANNITAGYFLLCEAKADTLRRMRSGSGGTPRASSTSRISSSTVAGASPARSSVTASSGTTAATASAHGSSQLAAAVAKARASESPGRGSSTSRPSTAASGGGGASSGGYVSARGHRTSHTPHQGEELGLGATGRMAVAV